MIPRARLEEVCKNFPQNCSSKQEIAEEGIRPGMNKPCQKLGSENGAKRTRTADPLHAMQGVVDSSIAGRDGRNQVLASIFSDLGGLLAGHGTPCQSRTAPISAPAAG